MLRLATEPPASLIEALGALLLTLAWGIREMIPMLKRRWARKRVRRAKEGYEGIGQLLDALEEGRRASGAARALVIVSQNSGGIPVPGVPVKVSIRYESASDHTRRIHGEFQDWPADAAYCDLLRDIASSGTRPVALTTKTMREGVLKDLYTADKIIGSKIYLLGHVPDGNWMAYASFNFEEGGAPIEDGAIAPSPEQRSVLQACVHRMRNVLREYHEVIV